MISNICPGERFFTQTLRTLEFASKGRQIINTVETDEQNLPQYLPEVELPSESVADPSVSTSSSSSDPVPAPRPLTEAEIMQKKLDDWRKARERKDGKKRPMTGKNGRGTDVRGTIAARGTGKPTRGVNMTKARTTNPRPSVSSYSSSSSSSSSLSSTVASNPHEEVLRKISEAQDEISMIKHQVIGTESSSSSTGLEQTQYQIETQPHEAQVTAPVMSNASNPLGFMSPLSVARQAKGAVGKVKFATTYICWNMILHMFCNIFRLLC